MCERLCAVAVAAAVVWVLPVAAGECDLWVQEQPSWLMCEDFEDGGGDFDAWLAGSDFISGVGVSDRGRVTLSTDNPHNGTYAVYMPASSDAGYQGASLDWRACDGAQQTNCSMQSFDSLFFRVWVRFADDHRYVHHFLNIGGSQPDDYWYHGTAGCLPNGELSMGTTVDFRENSHESHFYTYTPDMSCDLNCGNYMDVASVCQECADKGLPTCTVQQQCCWGNHYGPDEPHYFPVGEWFCFEMMMRANTPGVNDGSMAYWVNDSLIHREEGLMWRTSPTLALNRMRVQHYITTSDAEEHSNRVWFDDVVVSTEHIGPGESGGVRPRAARTIGRSSTDLMGCDIRGREIPMSTVSSLPAGVYLASYADNGSRGWRRVMVVWEK